MDKERPEPAEGDEARDHIEVEANKNRGQCLDAARVNVVEGMLAVCCEVVDVFGGVVHAVKAPEKSKAVLRAVTPVDQKVARKNDQNNFERGRQLSQNGRCEGVTHAVKDPAEHEQCERVEEENLPQVKEQVVEPFAPQPQGAAGLGFIGAPEIFEGNKNEADRAEKKNGLCEQLEEPHFRSVAGVSF